MPSFLAVALVLSISIDLTHCVQCRGELLLYLLGVVSSCLTGTGC